MATSYDLCIIGGGMFGSAAARHASANPSLKVCLIDPGEPTPEERSKREIFSSYYDAGRITRILDDDPACEVLSKHAISRYRELERLSGIKFHTPAGCLFIVEKNGSYLKSLLQAAEAKNVSLVDLSSRDLFEKRYPYLRLRDNEVALLDDNEGGHINPRKMVQAQKKVAALQGCVILDSIVSDIEQKDGCYQIKTEKGRNVTVKRLLITTGCFINTKIHSSLKLLKVSKHKETVALFKLAESEAKRLSSLPDVIYQASEDESFPNGINSYFLPPIQYPDGNHYIKVGLDGYYTEAKNLDDIKQWYLSKGDQNLVNMETRHIKMMLSGLKIDSVSSLTCVNCFTPTGLPYVDRITPTVTVAIAGNGKGAKFSEEIGRIAAQLSLTGNWDSKLDRTRFQAIFED